MSVSFILSSQILISNLLPIFFFFRRPTERTIESLIKNKIIYLKCIEPANNQGFSMNTMFRLFDASLYVILKDI
jgi:hypothetical protein